MEQKPKKNAIKRNKIQRLADDEKDLPDFFKESVSHGSKVQKDLHCKFFFEKS